MRVKKLLQLGVGLHSSGMLETPLEIACRQQGKKSEEIVDLLLAYGADNIARKIPRMLMTACTWSDLNMVKRLIEHDPTIVQVKNQYEENVIHCSAKNFFHGAKLLEYFLDEFECFELLDEHEENDLLPQVISTRLSCKILSIIVLNGGNLNCNDNRFKACPGFLPNCVTKTKNCPMRIAQVLLEKIGYKLNQKTLLELKFHEQLNNIPSNLTVEVQEEIDQSLDILNGRKLFINQTMLEFLMGDRSKTNNFAINEELIRQFLEKENINLYKGIIKSKLSKSLKRLNLPNDCYEKMYYVMELHLPLFIFEKISVFLNNLDLNSILKIELEEHES